MRRYRSSLGGLRTFGGGLGKRLGADEREALSAMASGPVTLMDGTNTLIARGMAREVEPLITSSGSYKRYGLTRRGESVAVQLAANTAAAQAGRPLPGQRGAEPFSARLARIRRFDR